MWITQSYLQIHHICLSFVYAFASCIVNCSQLQLPHLGLFHGTKDVIDSSGKWFLYSRYLTANSAYTKYYHPRLLLQSHTRQCRGTVCTIFGRIIVTLPHYLGRVLPRRGRRLDHRRCRPLRPPSGRRRHALSPRPTTHRRRPPTTPRRRRARPTAGRCSPRGRRGRTASRSPRRPATPTPCSRTDSAMLRPAPRSRRRTRRTCSSRAGRATPARAKMATPARAKMATGWNIQGRATRYGTGRKEARAPPHFYKWLGTRGTVSRSISSSSRFV